MVAGYCIFALAKTNNELSWAMVYEASIYLDNLTFRWISPLWKDKLLAESLNRGVDSKKAYDDVSFNDISAECFLLVSNDIVNNAANQ